MRSALSRFSIFFWCVVLVAATTACHTSRKAAAPVVRETTGLADKTAPDLQQLIEQNAFKAKTVAAKAAVKTNIGTESNSFNINLRMATDSVIWISISPLLGIEVARVKITRDSVKFMDRINKKFSVSDFNFLNNLLNINVDFDIIQGVLTGNLFAYRKNKFNSVYLEQDKYYILSTLSKKKLLRSLEDKDPNKPIVQDLWVEDQHYKIVRLNVEDQRVSKSLLTNYSDMQSTDGGLFPFKSQTNIKAEQDVSIDIEYTKLNINTDVEFPFNVPPGYEKIQ